MAEQTLEGTEQLADANETDATRDRAHRRADTDRARDYGRMRRIGSWHGAAVFAALGLFGATNYWALEANLWLAHVVAIGNAIVAGTVLSGIFHEWGHFAGARVSGAASPVLKKPARFYFMFNFDMENNSDSQFISMSLGGIGANWLLVLLIALLVPLGSWAAAALIAVAVANAVNVSVFEVPIVMAVKNGEDPQSALDDRLNDSGFRKLPGWLAGAFVFLALT